MGAERDHYRYRCGGKRSIADDALMPAHTRTQARRTSLAWVSPGDPGHSREHRIDARAWTRLSAALEIRPS